MMTAGHGARAKADAAKVVNPASEALVEDPDFSSFRTFRRFGGRTERSPRRSGCGHSANLAERANTCDCARSAIGASGTTARHCQNYRSISI